MVTRVSEEKNRSRKSPMASPMMRQVLGNSSGDGQALESGWLAMGARIIEKITGEQDGS